MNACADCGRTIGGQSRQCADCYRRNRTHPVQEWHCLDCGAPVERRHKRCADCNRAFLKRRPTYIRTPEHNARMRAATTGKSHNWRTGRPASATPEVAARITAWWTPERRDAARLRGKAHPHNQPEAWTPERRMAARQKGQKQASDPEWRARLRPRFGTDNHAWQGGISFEPYGLGFNRTLKAAIRKRDDYTCQACGKPEAEEKNGRLSIHHSDYDKANHSGTNLFAVCRACNTRLNNRRDEWRRYFARLAERRQLREDVSDLILAQIAAETQAPRR